MARHDVEREYQPISAWGYIGYQILFSIPVLGIIMLLVFAFGGGSNVNVRNFARSYVLVFVIAIVLVIAAFALGLFSYLAA